MNEILNTAFRSSKPYRGQGLAAHFGSLIYMSDADLQREGKRFLTVMTTWVYRKFRGRRKGGIPLGYLSRFVLRDDVEIDFTRALMVQIVRTLRKRGLCEYDEKSASPTFDLLVRAYERAQRR